jgi:fucose 4-O-acetylase-like acetyltransferase
MDLTKRPNFIDYSKAIGIYLVVFGHYGYFLQIPFKNDLLWNVVFNIYSFHIPLFFIISGYLFKFSDIKTGLSKGIRQLMIPYFLLSLISLMLGLIRVILFDKLSIQRIFDNVLGIISASDLGEVYSQYSIPLWFVYSLFFIKMYMEIGKKIKNKWVLYILIFITIVGVGLTIYRNDGILAFGLSSTLIGLTFFCIGFYAKSYINKITSLRMYELVVLLVFSLVLLIISLHINLDYNNPPGLSVFSSKFGRYPFLFFVSGIAGTLMIMSLSQILSRFKNRIILTLSNGTLIVLGFHQIVYLVFRGLVKSDNLYFAIFFSLFITAICYVLIKISAKYFPILLGKRKLKP